MQEASKKRHMPLFFISACLRKAGQRSVWSGLRAERLGQRAWQALTLRGKGGYSGRWRRRSRALPFAQGRLRSWWKERHGFPKDRQRGFCPLHGRWSKWQCRRRWTGQKRRQAAFLHRGSKRHPHHLHNRRFIIRIEEAVHVIAFYYSFRIKPLYPSIYPIPPCPRQICA